MSTALGSDDLDNLDLDLGNEPSRGRAGTTLNADDLLSSVEDLLADPSMHQRDPNRQQQQQQGQQSASGAAQEEEEEEEDFPYLEPLPAQPPSLGDTEGYKAYMKLRYEWQQRENAILLREMKRERRNK